ncbi:MAG TPA: DegV family protein, partial [Lachnospiraceae bacterium]|nr:DegV family protein [Lachnospiraceae bacterium]
MSVAIVTDSNSGITQEEAKKLGLHVLPMPFTINGDTYYEDINLTQDEFYRLLEDPEADLLTSQPVPGDVMDLWDRLLEENDEVVFIPMSSGLSGACESATVFAADYDGRVQVVNNQRISVTQYLSCLDAMKMAEDGHDAVYIKKRLEETKFESNIFITVDTMKYLKKGGRVTPAAAAFAELLGIKPVLRIYGEKLDAFAKAHGMEKAKKVMIKAIKDDLEKNYGGIDPKGANAWLGMAYTNNLPEAEEFRKEVQEAFPNYHIDMYPLSLSVSCHIGPGALAVTCTSVL